MEYILEEEVLVYKQEQLDQWKSGDKSLIPDFLDFYSDYENQPSYHFGEIFVLDHYHRIQEWNGFRFYALGIWELNNPKYDKSRKKIGELFSQKKMQRFWQARKSQDSRSGAGEPDVFLYNNTGTALFIEIKKGTDTVSAEQLTCLAQIKDILGAEVKIIYLREEKQQYIPAQYSLDIKNHRGHLIK